MKMIRFALAGAVPILALLLISPSTRAACVNPPSGLIAWYPGDDNSNDIVRGHNATLVNQVSYQPGEVLDAFYGDGSIDYVEVPYHPDFDFCATCPQTVEFWAYRTGNNTGHLFGKRDGCNGRPQNYQALWVGPDQIQYGSDTDGGVGTEPGFDAMPLNTWTHVACTFAYDSGSTIGTLSIYVNGVLHGSVSSTTTRLGPLNVGPLRFFDSGGCQEEFRGRMDEIKIYNRALTQAEIQGIYEAGTEGNCKTPVTSAWKPNPPSGDWNTAANWTNGIAPNGYLASARFRGSSRTALSTSTDVEVASLTFFAGASAYTITANHNMTISGTGVINSSGQMQNWLMPAPKIDFAFTNSASAGNLTTYTVDGATQSGEEGASIEFLNSSKAAGATLIANGGSNGGGAGTISFRDTSIGGTSSIVCNGGSFDISGHAAPGVSVGSIEGASGLCLLGGNRLTVGGNNKSTTFSGDIGDDIFSPNGFVGRFCETPSAMGAHPRRLGQTAYNPLAGGSITKVGTGTLTLGGANTYTGGTTMSGGALLLERNGTSSQTGTGNVTVTAGILGGDGRLGGNVTIGNNTGSRAILAPGFSDDIGDDLFMPKKLSFRGDGDFVCKFDSGQVAADRVHARGVAINAGATFNFTEIGVGQMAIGTTFILIDNTSNTAISGTFDNVPEGAELIFGNYKWKFSYAGGTGNDFSGEIIENVAP